MENIKKNSRLNYKGNAVKFKDDDYETTEKILKDLIPYLEPNKIIYDPFFCEGFIKEEWNKLSYICINNKVDAFEKVDFDFDYLITNPPFSCKQKVLDLCLSYDKPFMVLLPIDTLGSKWIKPYFDKLQFIIPNGRYNFYKKSQKDKKSSSWFDTMWICYKINLNQKVIKL
tara:strand:- start:467 stop:979 length:513 start_codon:yes stop_codon:yes gene_type:complete